MVARLDITPGWDVAEIRKQDKQLARKLGDYRAPFRKFHIMMVKAAVEAIRTEGSSKGVKWQALQRRTLRRKRRLKKQRKGQGGYKLAMLMGTGDMFKVVKKRSGYRRRLTKKEYVFGPTPREHYYHIFHIRGTKSSMPQRDFVSMTEAEERELDKLIAENVDRIMNEWLEGLSNGV